MEKTDDACFNLATVLYAAIDTGAWSIEHVRAWAVRLVEQANQPAVSLMDLCSVEDARSATATVMTAFRERGLMLPDKQAELFVGLLHLRFERGGLSPMEFEAAVADVVDPYDGSFLTIEEWTAQMKDSPTVPDSLSAQLERLGHAAAKALERLEDIPTVVRDSFFTET